MGGKKVKQIRCYNLSSLLLSSKAGVIDEYFISFIYYTKIESRTYFIQ